MLLETYFYLSIYMITLAIWSRNRNLLGNSGAKLEKHILMVINLQYVNISTYNLHYEYTYTFLHIYTNICSCFYNENIHQK